MAEGLEAEATALEVEINRPSPSRIFNEAEGPDDNVTLISFLEAYRRQFDQADTNHDGTLDAAEQAGGSTASPQEP